MRLELWRRSESLQSHCLVMALHMAIPQNKGLQYGPQNTIRVEFYFLTFFLFFLFFFGHVFFFFVGWGLGGGHPCNCRHFGTLGSSCNMKSVNRHRDRGGRRRHPCNCRYFWTLESSCNLKSVNSHRDRGGRRRHPCNCRYFWTLESSCNYEKY